MPKWQKLLLAAIYFSMIVVGAYMTPAQIAQAHTCC